MPTLLAKDDKVITYADAATIMPFNNTMQTADLTGAQFTKVLEQQWQPKGQARPFLNLGLSENVTYTFDPDAKDGSHVTSVMIDGKPLDPKATYTVASNSFLVAGGDNFTEFANATNVKDSGLIDQSLFMEWIKSHSPLSPNFATDHHRRCRHRRRQFRRPGRRRARAADRRRRSCAGEPSGVRPSPDRSPVLSGSW